ncbi:chitosanase [Spirosoma sp. KCTC 42546]|uniref:chitosanase n=1 Tax=Spirosoma sp. KCTC 42546 TaxID=2520506 RepID=UPI001156E9A2|nr:chitosanase [Spirosoma sp. KCTC 42546]QDK80413.1 chitosanase [Spirosoma sp. KCTC 42546]
MITVAIKSKIEQIVNVFETGTAEGKYDALVIFKDGKDNTRQITYGRSQTTEQGNLKTLIELYINRDGKFADDFVPYRTKIGTVPLVDDATFKDLLRKSAREDAIMRSTQDEFFDILYYMPALNFFTGFDFTLPLSLLVIYDSFIHSGGVPTFLRERFPERPPSRGGNEKAWVTAYVKTRDEWLATNKKIILRGTVYRTRCFLTQLENDNWTLSKPVNAHGVVVP